MANNLTDADKIACCRICTLAEVMRDCKTCPFNVGLKYKQPKESDKIQVTRSQS